MVETALVRGLRLRGHGEVGLEDDELTRIGVAEGAHLLQDVPSRCWPRIWQVKVIAFDVAFNCLDSDNPPNQLGVRAHGRWGRTHHEKNHEYDESEGAIRNHRELPVRPNQDEWYLYQGHEDQHETCV